METTPFTLLDWLLNAPLDDTPQPTLNDWRALSAEYLAGWALPVDRAMVGGFLADRAAYAFAAGYQAALRRLVPTLPPDDIAALCITEEGSAHPRDMHTCLTAQGDDYRLDGKKSFVTSALEAEHLLVAACTGVDDRGKNRLRVLLLPRDTAGVQVTPLPDLPFVPEISHGTVTFEAVDVPQSALLPGDGYSAYVKPFRTLEDVHVFAGITAYLLRLARQYDWLPALRAQHLDMLLVLHTLGQADPHLPVVHLALDGVMQQMQALLAALEPAWETAEAQVRAWWQRDKALLGVAGKVRGQRTANAWAYYGMEQPAGA